jgi:hypothetical protein
MILILIQGDIDRMDTIGKKVLFVQVFHYHLKDGVIANILDDAVE